MKSLPFTLPLDETKLAEMRDAVLTELNANTRERLQLERMLKTIMLFCPFHRYESGATVCKQCGYERSLSL